MEIDGLSPAVTLLFVVIYLYDSWRPKMATATNYVVTMTQSPYTFMQ